MRERVCKNCGGRQYTVVGQNMVKCMFCGTLYVDEHASKEEETLTVFAYEKLRSFRFDEALDEFDKILGLYPLSFEAYFGKVLAKHKIVLYSRRGTSNKKPRFFGSKICRIIEDPDYKSALENAPAEVAKNYSDTASVIEKIADGYEQIGEKKHDIVLCAMNYDKTNPNGKIQDFLSKTQEKNLSTYFVQAVEKEKEEETFSALKTANVFVLYANKQNGYNENEVKNLFDRYRYFISQKQKTPTSFVIAFDNGVCIGNLPKDFDSFKSQIDLSEEGVADSLVLKVIQENEKAASQVAKIEKVSLKKVSSVKKKQVEIESINAAELGNYKVENIELSEANKIKWVFISLKNGDFASARKVANKELKKDPNNAELLFATLLCDYKVHTAGEFFLDIANLKEKDRIDNILKYASKDFAEMIVDNWSNLVISLDSVEYYNSFLLYLAQYNTPNRDKLVTAAENKALETLDTSLIEKVLKCFQNDDVDRFVNFYFMLAKNSGDDNYYKKVLDIDEGHEQSNIAILLKNFKDDDDKLEFRKKDVVEDTLKFLSKEKRAQLISSIVNIILPVCYKDLKKAQEQLDFYLAYVEDDYKLSEILKKVAVYLQQMRFYTAAEKYIVIAISKNKTNAELYWILIQIKCHCNSETKLFKTNVNVSEMPEWQSLLECADEAQAEKYGAIISKANLYAGEKVGIAPEWLDKDTLQVKLNDFVIRNNKILLEMAKEEGKGILRGANYFKLQLEPFDNYVDKLKKDLTLEEYQDIAKKIATRLSLLDLTLDMSINVGKLQGRESVLRAAKAEKLSVKGKTKVKSEKNQQTSGVVEELDKHKKFTKRYLFGFLELFPVAFTTLLLAVIIAVPKEVYMYFNQNFVIALVCLGALFSIVHLTFYLIRKNRIHKNWKIANLTLITFGFLNVALMCIGFYLMPTVVTIKSAKEFNRLVHNAPYAELRLDADVDMSGIKWKPADFSGTLDGNNHLVLNLNVVSKKNVSMFLTNNGTIKNLKVQYTTKTFTNISNFAGIAVKNSGRIRECRITAENTIVVTTNKNFKFGGIASKLDKGTISACNVRLNVSITSNGASVIYGGIAGLMKEGKATVVDNLSQTSLYLVENNSSSAKVGGLVGELENFENNKLNFNANKASVNFSISGVSGQMFVGGLVGDGNDGVSNNYSVGKIAISASVGEGGVGGLYGKYVDGDLKDSINHCYSTVSIVCQNGMKVGSVVGLLGGIVDHCFSSVPVADRAVVGNAITAFANYSNWVNGGVKAYNGNYGFDPSVWNIRKDGLPILHFE